MRAFAQKNRAKLQKINQICKSFGLCTAIFRKKSIFYLLISKKSSNFAHNLLKCRYERIIERED